MLNLALEFSRKGNQTIVVAIYGENFHKEKLEAAGINYFVLSNRKSVNLRNLILLFSICLKLRKVIVRNKPDIIHSHLFMPKLLLLLLHPIIKVPIVQTQHDNSPWWRLSSIGSKSMSKVEAWFSSFVVKHNVAISESVKSDLQKYCNVPNDRVSVIYNAVADNLYYRPKTMAHDQFKILFVSRLTWKKKGLDTVIAIARQVVETGLIPNFKFIVVGDGPDRKKMEREVAKKNLANYFEFRGYQSDVYIQYREADLLLLPSRWEGFGLVAGEAALSGVPVVASAVGGLPEVILDGKTGFLCPPEDVECFVSQINKLYSDRALCLGISKFARQSASERFSLDRAVNQYRKVYVKFGSKSSPKKAIG